MCTQLGVAACQDVASRVFDDALCRVARHEAVEIALVVRLDMCLDRIVHDGHRF
jgi:hypothetical protein